MTDVSSRIAHVLSASPDYWEGARRAVDSADSLEGLLPEFRALPECPEATALVPEGAAASRALLGVVERERADSAAFRNALFLLLYFDDLFVYRDLKAQYRMAAPGQRPWLDVACRKILLRCLEVPETASDAQTREIVRNTWRGRLATTSIIVDLAAHSFLGRQTIIRDMAVSDGVTTLDLAEETARRGADASITGSDLRLYLRYAERDGNAVVCDSAGQALQYEIAGQTYGVTHAEVPPALAAARAALDAAAAQGTQTITTLAPQVDHAVQAGRYALCFREEDAFRPEADIAQADIIRIANLLVERDEEHRGYFYRTDILAALSRLGRLAKDGAYLFLDNFRRRIEHVGLWRKEHRQWTRLPVAAPVATDLEGVTDIPIEPIEAV